jgi:TRAP transporter TAXI family solute receptor
MTIRMRGNTRYAGAGRATAAIAVLTGVYLGGVCLAGAPAAAQAYGLATMQPGTLAHTTGTAIAKVLKDKGGLNTLVQTTAGETVLIPMVARGEIDLGVANLAEGQAQVEVSGPNRQADLRLIGVIHPLWASFFVRKDTTMKTNADMKGKRVALGYSAMRTVDMLVQAQLALGGLTAKDVTPVLVPNVMRGADDFIAGAVDALYFAFGAPKVREADASVGGIRALDASASPERLAESRKLFPYGYLTPTGPAPIFVGVTEPINVYTIDYMLFTNAKVKDDVVYKIIDTLAQNKPDLVAMAPHLGAFNPGLLYKKFDMAYHPGALKYFADHKMQPVEIK